MRINLYSYSLPIVFSYCYEVLKGMKYEIHYADFRGGLISAARDEDDGRAASLFDLKFSNDQFSVGIAIVSSSCSNAFGHICDNPEAEKAFIENLFNILEAKQIGIPFHKEEKHLIDALAS